MGNRRVQISKIRRFSRVRSEDLKKRQPSSERITLVERFVFRRTYIKQTRYGRNLESGKRLRNVQLKFQTLGINATSKRYPLSSAIRYPEHFGCPLDQSSLQLLDQPLLNFPKIFLFRDGFVLSNAGWLTVDAQSRQTIQRKTDLRIMAMVHCLSHQQQMDEDPNQNNNSIQ